MLSQAVPTVAEKLGEFVASIRQLPSSASERAATCLSYNVGISYAMRSSAVWTMAEDISRELYGDVEKGGAALLASGRRSSIAGAAFANAAIFGAGGRGDTLGTIHVGQSILSPLLALMESRQLPSERLLPALVAGYEVGGRLDRAYGEEVAHRGFRSTAVFGPVAAAAACAALLRLNALQASSAIASACTMTGGSLQPFSDGSEEPRWQPGRGATLGLLAALLAERGGRGASRAIEGEFGLVRAMTGRDAVAGEIENDLGTRWMIEEVTFKPFPVCAFTQTPVYAGVAANKKLKGAIPQEFTVRLNPREASYAGLDFTGPFTTPIELMMSAPYAVANGLVTGRTVDMPAIMRLAKEPEIAALLQNSRLVSDPHIAPLSTVIELRMSDGATVTHAQIMSAQDYRFGQEEVRTMVRDTIAGLPDAHSAQDRFNRFQDAAARGISPRDVNELFVAAI